LVKGAEIEVEKKLIGTDPSPIKVISLTDGSPLSGAGKFGFFDFDAGGTRVWSIDNMTIIDVS